MASVAWDYARTGIWRFSRRDAILVALAVLHGVILAVWPLTPLIAVGVWWNSNTIAHNFIHRPFFQSAGMKPPVFRRFECSAGHPADALARSSPGASRARRMAIPCFATPCGRDRGSWFAFGRRWRRCAHSINLVANWS